MTGEIATEVTDASASGIYDVKNRRWAKELIRRVGLSGDNFPDCYESGEIAGYVTMKCAELTGLKEGIPVLYGLSLIHIYIAFEFGRKENGKNTVRCSVAGSK